MLSNTSIPEIIDSKSHTESVVVSENPSDPEFLEYALFLKDHGYFKEMETQELREKLRELYRKKNAAKPTTPEDVWK